MFKAKMTIKGLISNYNSGTISKMEIFNRVKNACPEIKYIKFCVLFNDAIEAL